MPPTSSRRGAAPGTAPTGLTGPSTRRRGVPARALSLAGIGALLTGFATGAAVVDSPAGPLGWIDTARAEEAPARGAERAPIDPLPTEPGIAAEPAAVDPAAVDPAAVDLAAVDPAPEPERLPDPYLADGTGLTPADRAVGLTGAETPRAASGTLVVVPGTAEAPHPDRPVLRVRVEVEDGLPVAGALFAETVMAVLNDPRGWGADGSVSFARTDGVADLRVVLASPDTVDSMCAPLRTAGRYSCGRNGHAALNFTRWATGTVETETGAALATYREYLVNHEVGHLLGHPHVSCPGDGETAPIMQQQSVKAAPCVLNGWPVPGLDR